MIRRLLDRLAGRWLDGAARPSPFDSDRLYTDPQLRAMRVHELVGR